MKRDEVIDRTNRIRALIDDLVALEAIYSTRHSVVLRGTSRVPTADLRETVIGRLKTVGYDRAVVETTPGSGSDGGRILISVPLQESKAARIPWVNIVLFILTVASTTLLGGPAFAFWFLTILLFHEFGHFILARRRKIDASWPYFIPAPNILGTFGAFIQLRSPIRDRRALFDMAVAGPLAGFVIAVLALFVGLSQSTIVGPDHEAAGMILGDSLLFKGIAALVFPGMASDQNILLHPIAFAGWAGLLVTMFNLLPIGQLDGGHIAYAMLGKRQRWLALGALGFLATIAFWWPWWLMWVAIGVIMRPQHPPTLLDEVAVGPARKVLGWLAFIVFVICFTPVPFSL